jgi:hypothetical protein
MPLENELKIFTYINFYKGRFTLKAKDGDTSDKIIVRINKNNETVREYHYDKLSGVMLADIREGKHEEFGSHWEFVFLDGNEYKILRLSKKSRIATQFFNKLENLVLSEPFTIRSFYFEEEDRGAIAIYQNSKKLENVYTKENPGNLPPPKQQIINGELVWDWTDQLEYWHTLIESLKPHMIGIDENLIKVVKEEVIESESTELELVEQISSSKPSLTPEYEEEDDLPF